MYFEFDIVEANGKMELLQCYVCWGLESWMTMNYWPYRFLNFGLLSMKIKCCSMSFGIHFGGGDSVSLLKLVFWFCAYESEPLSNVGLIKKFVYVHD